MVLLGDWRQLPSVRAGNLLTDMLTYCMQSRSSTSCGEYMSSSVSMVELTHNYRVQTSVHIDSSSISIPGLAQCAVWIGESLFADVDHLCSTVMADVLHVGQIAINRFTSPVCVPTAPAVRLARQALLTATKQWFAQSQTAELGTLTVSFRNCGCVNDKSIGETTARNVKLLYQFPLIESPQVLNHLCDFYKVRYHVFRASMSFSK
jgi:hypothetical protein